MVLPPLYDSWTMFIIHFSIALNKTPYTDCWRVGADLEGYLEKGKKTLLWGGGGGVGESFNKEVQRGPIDYS